MDPSHIATLRDKLQHAKTLTDIWEYFLDHLSEDKEFEAASHRTRSELVESIFEQFCLSTVRAKPKGGSLLLVRHVPSGLVHGGAFAGGMMVNVLFFEDLMTGVFSTIDPTRRRPTQTARFTAKPAPGSTHPERN